MYSVYAVIDGNEICIYDDWSDAEELRIIDPQLELERNSSGTFTFTLPPTNIAYGTYILKTYTISGYDQEHHPIMEEHDREVDLIQRIATKIIIYRDMNITDTGSRTKHKLWEGRVINEEKDWYNQRMVTCEGDLAYFNDTCQKPALFGFAADITDDPLTLMTHVINYHNSKVDNSRTFILASDSTITDSRIGEQKQYEITYQSTMETIQELIKTFGGVIQVYHVAETVGDLTTWKRMIRWDNADNIVRVSTLQPQTINFGKNLLDFKCKWDLSKLCTVAVPTGAKLENDGKDEIGDSIGMLGGDHSQWLYLDEDGIVYTPKEAGQTISDFRLESYQTGVYDVAQYVNDCETQNQERVVYISCRLTNNVVAYCTASTSNWKEDTDWGDTQLSYLVASPQQGYIYQDFIDYKVTLPYGTKSIALCSYGNDIKMGVKKRKFVTTNTVTETVLIQTGSDTQKRLKFKTHPEAIPDTDPVEYKTVRDDPPKVEFDDNTNYICRTYNFPSELISQIDSGNGKIYVSGRAENGTAVCVVMDDVGGLSGSGNQTFIYEANQSNANIKELNHDEIELHAGDRSITIVGYRGGSGMPKVSYNRSETKVSNANTPKDKYVTVETSTKCPEWHEVGSEYVINKSLVEKYGYIERILSFEDIVDPDLLCQTAVSYLQNIAFDEMTIDISAIDLRALGATDVDYFCIEDSLRCVSEYHGLDKFLPITKLSIPLNKPENMKVTIGETTQETMSENTNRVDQDLMDSIVTNRVMTLELAKQHALSIMTEGDSGYVSLIRDGEHIKEIVFASTVDPKDSSNIWVWNQHGLCHADHYPLTDYEETRINAAITQTGHIVADYITAGTLRSILMSGTRAVFGVEKEEGGGFVEGSILMSSHQKGSLSGKYKGTEFANGNIRYFDHDGIELNEGSHSYTIDGEEEYARIYGWTEDPNGTQLLSISAKILAFNVDDVWISSDSIYHEGGGSDAIRGYSSTDYHYVLNSNADLTGADSAQKVYLPKKKDADPNDDDDWVECYVSDGILINSTSVSPIHGVGFRHGITYEVT
jgi:hypothetical protein